MTFACRRHTWGTKGDCLKTLPGCMAPLRPTMTCAWVHRTLDLQPLWRSRLTPVQCLPTTAANWDTHMGAQRQCQNLLSQLDRAGNQSRCLQAVSNKVVPITLSLWLEPEGQRGGFLQCWWRIKRPCAYRRVAVRAGMLLRKVKRITTNMKKRSRGLLAHEEVHFPASASPGLGRRVFSMQLHS